MAIESIAAGIGGVNPAPGGTSRMGGEAFEAFRPASPVVGPEAVRETRTAHLGGPAEAALRPSPVAEVHASPSRDDTSLGTRVLNRLDTLQRGEVAVHRHDLAQVAHLDPGPAGMPLRPGLSEARPSPDQNGGAAFATTMELLREMSGQVVQVSIVTKTTSSFTGSLNKLLSSG